MAEPRAKSATPRVARRARCLGLVLLGLSLAVGWAVISERGLRLVLRAALPQLEYQTLHGSLLNGVELNAPRFADAGLSLRATRVTLRWRPSLAGGLVLHELHAQAVEIVLADAGAQHPLSWPRLPLAVRIDHLRIDRLSVTRGVTRYAVSDVEAALKLTRQGLRVPHFVVHTATQRVSGHGSYAGVLTAALRWAGRLDGQLARASLALHGPLAALAVDLKLQRPWSLALHGQLDGHAQPLFFKGVLDAALPVVGAVQGQLQGGLAGFQLGLHIPLSAGPPGARDLMLQFDLKPRVALLAGELHWVVGAAGERDLARGTGTLALDRQALTLTLDASSPSAASLRGRVLFDRGGPAVGATLRWQDLPLTQAGARARSYGWLRLRGGMTKLTVTAASVVTQTPIGKVAAHGKGTWTGARLELQDVQARLLDGQLRSQGHVEWRAGRCAELSLDFAGLDFAGLNAALASRLDGRGHTRWCQRTDGLHGTFALEHMSGRWRGHAVRGRGEFERSAQRSAIRAGHLEVGANVLDAELTLTPALAGRFKLAATDLAALLPTWRGRLDAQGDLGGSRAQPALRAALTGAELAFGSWHARTLSAQVDVDAARATASHIDLRLRALRHDGRPLGDLTLHGSGTARAHRVDAQLAGANLHGTLAAQGAWTAPRWGATVTALSLSSPAAGRWQLTHAAALVIDRQQFVLGPACLGQDGARLCATVPHWGPVDGAAQLSLNELPLTAVAAWLPATLTPRGTLAGQVALSVKHGVWSGQGDARISDASLRYHPPGHAAQDVPLRDVRGRFAIDAERLRATAVASLGEWLQLQGELAVGLAPHAPLAGEVRASLPEIAWIEEFLPELAGSAGSARGRATLSGQRESPLLDSEFELLTGTVQLPRFGTQLTALVAHARGIANGKLSVDGHTRIGAGTMTMDGDFEPRAAGGPRARLQLRGEQLALVRLPDIEADAAPNVTLDLAPGTVDLRGQVGWSRLRVQRPRLPERAIATSADEVLIDASLPAAVSAPRPRWFVDTLAADLDFKFGDDVLLAAADLDAKIMGTVHWHKPRHDARGRGNGRLTITAGHYKAYGQDLQIQGGELLFAGAIDNPTLNIRAIRPELDVKAGVRVTGSLQVPKFALFAEPSLPDAEVLSYLVTGRALANATAGEAGVIARAALSLGVDRAALVTSQLSNLFSLDEFGINPGKNARTSAIVAGKRLTPKLTVRSEFNPFERVWSFFLNYKLTPRWSVEAQTGAGQGADVIYSVERDPVGHAPPLKTDPAPPRASP